ncbi:hypothetical protein BSFP_029400 [Burkholderia stabilis]|uniref:Uncharacterized protein n=1 Tax=Burkholderia stabilis TaxID=95485 RepID=A0A1Y1BJR6_9BURK|nr:hypothetical protein BSFP_029400 [Burkholderia stabilis]
MAISVCRAQGWRVRHRLRGGGRVAVLNEF